MRKISLKHELERQLLPRLKLLGILLIMFGVGALLYGLIATVESSKEPIAYELIAYELTDEVGTLNPNELEVPELKREIIYLGVTAFWIVGAACLFFASWRNSRLKHR